MAAAVLAQPLVRKTLRGSQLRVSVAAAGGEGRAAPGTAPGLVEREKRLHGQTLPPPEAITARGRVLQTLRSTL